MRFLLVLLLCSPAYADARFDVHVGGGLEGGMIQGKARPDALAELGVGADYFGPKYGIGVVLERVSRPSAGVEIATETKLDVLARLRVPKKRFVAGIGMGVRRLSIDGEKDSTVWGVDLFRMMYDFELARTGRVSISIYFAWTFGLYRGEIYGERFGDMPYPTMDYGTIANSYVLGLQTSIDTH